MIKINLLQGPKARAARPQWDVRGEASLAGGVLLVAIVGCWWYSSTLDAEIETLQGQKTEKQKQVALLNEQVKQVQDFEQKKKQLEDKNRVIDQLEKSRAGPVRVLDFVSRSLDPLKLWLIRLNVKDATGELEGRALTNDDVVEFVNNLRRTDYFSNIRLLESRSTAEGKVNLYQFKLGFLLKD